MGLLDIYNASLAQLTVLDPDLVTQYPPTITGTPNAAQNPGGPPRNFDPRYDSTNTYLSTNPSNVLLDSVAITNLDVENPGVQGGPQADIITQYPADVTGTPTNTQNPGGPVKRFRQPWLPSLKYISLNPVAGATSGILRNTLPITNFDVENPGVNGGPIPDIITQYPPLVTGTPNSIQNLGITAPFVSGAPPSRFSQPWLPNLTYLTFNPIATNGSGKLYSTLNITNLDVENAGVLGGPLNDIVTNYFNSNYTWATGAPTTSSNNSNIAPFESGNPASNFVTKWTPMNSYRNANPIAGANSGIQYNVNPNGNNSLKIVLSTPTLNLKSLLTSGLSMYLDPVISPASFSATIVVNPASVSVNGVLTCNLYPESTFANPAVLLPP